MVEYKILKYFKYDHLPVHLQEISKPFCDIATSISKDDRFCDPAETTVALRKLLEAKDAAVRATLK